MLKCEFVDFGSLFKSRDLNKEPVADSLTSKNSVKLLFMSSIDRIDLILVGENLSEIHDVKSEAGVNSAARHETL